MRRATTSARCCRPTATATWKSNVNQGDGGDLFGVVAGVALSSQSKPHSREWDGRDSGLVVSDVAQPGDRITFRVGQALAAQTATGEQRPMLPIPDANSVGVTSVIAIAASGVAGQIRVDVDISHTYIGDLRVELVLRRVDARSCTARSAAPPTTSWRPSIRPRRGS